MEKPAFPTQVCHESRGKVSPIPRWGLQAEGGRRDNPESPTQGPNSNSGPRPAWERGGLQAHRKAGCGWGTLTHSRVHTSPCSPCVCLLRYPGPEGAPLCCSLPGSMGPSALVWLPNPHRQPDTQVPLYERAVFTCQERQPFWRDPRPATHPTPRVTGGETKGQDGPGSHNNRSGRPEGSRFQEATGGSQGRGEAATPMRRPGPNLLPCPALPLLPRASDCAESPESPPSLSHKADLPWQHPHSSVSWAQPGAPALGPQPFSSGLAFPVWIQNTPHCNG